jgi:hypothetical protein
MRHDALEHAPRTMGLDFNHPESERAPSRGMRVTAERVRATSSIFGGDLTRDT